MRAHVLLAAAAAIAATGCARPTAYYWGSYETALYRHYKTPAEREVWVASLKTTIEEAEQRGMKVAPGICAEYGYALFEEGQAQQAVTWFQREKTTWPESTVLMDKMIRNAQRKGAQPPPAGPGPAGAVERRS